MSEGPEWFAPKRYGYGAGLPISWQGWALVIAYLVADLLASLFVRYSWIGAASVLIILTVAFLVICARTTKGGWRWRWGKEEK